MATKSERELVLLSDSILDAQVVCFKTQQAISLRAHGKLERLLSEMTGALEKIEQQWSRMSQQAAA